jgi:molybdopterin-guanine dinucleotide biosynthesis protein A
MPPTPYRHVIAAVLNGGASTRFGQDKAIFRIDGVPMIGHVIQAVAALDIETVFVGRAMADMPNIAAISDNGPPAGPLGAMLAVIDAFPGRDILLLPCDLPRLTPAHLKLLAAPLNAGVGARVPVIDGIITPIPGHYSAHAVGHFRTAAAAGGRSLRAVLDGLDLDRLLPETLGEAGLEPAGFDDIDTPEALAAYLELR